MDPQQLRRRRLRRRGRVAATGHVVDDERAVVAACRHEPLVAEALHERDIGTPHADRVPARLGRLAREPVARHVRDHHVEGVRRAAAMRRRVGEQVDDLHLLDERARPSVADDERQRILVLRANVDEVDVQPVDLGDELWDGVEPRLALAPVVLRLPVASDRLDRLQLHALRWAVDGLLFGPAGGSDACPQVFQVRLGDLDRERSQLGVGRYLVNRGGHVGSSLDCGRSSGTPTRLTVSSAHRARGSPGLLPGSLSSVVPDRFEACVRAAALLLRVPAAPCCICCRRRIEGRL